MPSQPPPTTYCLTKLPLNLLFIPLLAFLLSGCSTYKKVYTADPYIQVKQGFYKTEVVNGVKGRYVTMRVWNLGVQGVKRVMQWAAR
jgi:hypothetical protein